MYLGVRFPSTFMNTAKTSLRRLFRVYAHIYHAHFDQICALGIEGVSALLNESELTPTPSSASEYQLPPFPPLRRRGEPSSPLLYLHLQFSLLSEKDLVPLEDFNKTILEETGSK